MLDVFPDVDARLNQLARIKHSSVLESAVMKIQDAREQDLTTTENRAVLGPLLEQSAALETDPVSDCIVEQVIKRLRASVKTAKFEYLDTHYLLPTPNVGKPVFSTSVHALTSRHREILPHNFATQKFLYINWNFSGIEDSKIVVHDIRKNTTREAAPDIELFDSLTCSYRLQATAAPRIQ